MDDSGTNALIGDAEAIKRMFYGPEYASTADDLKASPADVPGHDEQAKEEPTEKFHIPVGYFTDSTVAVESRPRARRTVTRGHLQLPMRILTRSAGAEMEWVDLTGPPAVRRLPNSRWPAQIIAPTWVPAPCGASPLGGQARGGESERRDAVDQEILRTGNSGAAKHVATPVRVKDAEESLVKSTTMKE